MLRKLFGEPPREDEGETKQAMDAIDRYLEKVRSLMNKDGDPHHDLRKYEVWTVGLKTSLDELEQSLYASSKFTQRVNKVYEEDMTEQELDDYYRHVYFYKDGFIRVFSVLDKLGTLLNEVLHLGTERVKNRYSFFTVLRQMRSKGVTPELTNRLNYLKDVHKDTLQRLRKKRNTEIHHMNTELQDDLWQLHRSLHEKVKLENIQSNIDDLHEAYIVVCHVMSAVFERLVTVR